MGLARVAIALIAVVLALGLLIVGGVALWRALAKDTSNSQTTNSPDGSGTPGQSNAASATQPSRRAGNALEIRCLAVQCKVYVAGPGPTDVQFSGFLSRNERRVFQESRLTLVVDDASAVAVVVNGKAQPRGRPGQRKTYQIPTR